MKKKIMLCQKKIEYTLRVRKGQRGIRFAIYEDGRFVVTAPRFTSVRRIEKSILEKAEWIVSTLAHFEKNMPQALLAAYSRKQITEYTVAALKLASARLAHFNVSYGYTWKKITIKNQKTRWGSCSTKGNLNFNYKIALLPPSLADYIIVHELCHLGVFNHSDNFWNLVSRTIPDYHERRKQLKQSSSRLR